MTNLPPAIQLLRDVLASDQGQARADSLLAIQGAGPDYVRQHVTALDAALGTFSPGVPGLRELIRKAEEAVSTSQPTVERQHVISEVVLRRFAGSVPSGGRQLARFDFAAGQDTLAKAKDVGYIENFVPVDSQATEDLWHTVETRLRQAITAALNGTTLDSPAHVTTLRHAVALHFVRNPQTLTIHNQSFADALQNGIDALANTSLAAEAFRQKYGLEPAGPEALRLGAEAVHGPPHQAARGGRPVPPQRPAALREGLRPVRHQGHPDPDPRQHIQGVPPRRPPRHHRRPRNGRRRPAGVTIDQADEILMPLTPGSS